MYQGAKQVYFDLHKKKEVIKNTSLIRITLYLVIGWQGFERGAFTNILGNLIPSLYLLQLCHGQSWPETPVSLTQRRFVSRRNFENSLSSRSSVIYEI